MLGLTFFQVCQKLEHSKKMDAASQLKRLHASLTANGVAASELPASVDEATDKLLGMGRKRKRPEQTFAGTIRAAVEARVEERLKTLPLNLLRAMRSELESTDVQLPTQSLLSDKVVLPKKVARLLLDS